MIGRSPGVLRLALAAGSVLVLSGRAGRAQDPLFDDVTARAGIRFVHQAGATPDKYMMETFGSGVAWIDIDNDGFQDLYFVNGAVGASNILYRNNRNGTFKHHGVVWDCGQQ